MLSELFGEFRYPTAPLGDYDSDFPDEYAFEEWLYRLECLAEDEQQLAEGEHVSGPAADTYRYRITEASRQFAGRVLTSERQARDLVGNPLLQIHHGRGKTCVLNPATAACQLRGPSTTLWSPRTPTTADPSAQTSRAPTATSSTSSTRWPNWKRSSPTPSPAHSP